MGAACLIRREVRVDSPVLGMSVRSGVKHGAAVRKDRFTCKMFVRISDSIPTVEEGAIERPIQSCGGTVSEATTVTELVAVEALRMSNSLCEAFEEPPYMAGVRRKENKYDKNSRALEATSSVRAVPYQFLRHASSTPV